jgi:hypothetical protein
MHFLGIFGHLLAISQFAKIFLWQNFWLFWLLQGHHEEVFFPANERFLKMLSV